ncbi:carbohydrate ABC transporter permease [Microbacterium aurantiacum]|uniref:Sugar ABC transporter permease n=1 Tax=Microbacterium aurantiacum TaxID=162393 RepID=A0AAJ2HI12_9MICO|nr:sugar ABC transporter permease [Microbacterium aurantiacum]MDS0244865.1 sugar ABC transporter permease [Microbacterium aurantiacum]
MTSTRTALLPGKTSRLPRQGLGAGLRRFAVPAYIMVGIFFVLPQLLNLYFAFTNWTTYSSDISWNGLGNFELLAKQGRLFHPLAVTLGYAVVAMIFQNVIGLSLAYALRRSTPLNGLFRSLFFLPVLLSPLAVGYIWRGLLKPDGPVNDAISVVVPGFGWAWLGEPATALAAVAFMDAWKWIGLTTLVYIAGINSVPGEVLEAAKLDGANGWSSFWRITFPLLAPAFTFNVVSTFVGAFSAYDVIQASTGGGPGDSTRALFVELRLQWAQGNFGTGSALGLMVTLLVVVIAVPLVWYLRRREARI